MDNGNVFLNFTNPADDCRGINTNRYKEFRNSTTPIPNGIDTDPSLLTFTESEPLFTGLEYQVFNNASSSIDRSRPNPIFFTSLRSGNNGTVDYADVDRVLDLTNDSITYTSYGTEGE